MIQPLKKKKIYIYIYIYIYIGMIISQYKWVNIEYTTCYFNEDRGGLGGGGSEKNILHEKGVGEKKP